MGSICCPDSAFETEYKGVRRAWYIEREMGSDTPGRVAAKKTKGYAGLQPLFKKHFPHASDFRVLAICPFPQWRDQLVLELKKNRARNCGSRHCAGLTAEKFLHEPIFYKLAPDTEKKLAPKARFR